MNRSEAYSTEPSPLASADTILDVLEALGRGFSVEQMEDGSWAVVLDSHCTIGKTLKAALCEAWSYSFEHVW